MESRLRTILTSLVFIAASGAASSLVGCSNDKSSAHSSTAEVIGATTGSAIASATLRSIIQSAAQPPLDSGMASAPVGPGLPDAGADVAAPSVDAGVDSPPEPEGDAGIGSSDGGAPADDGGGAAADAEPADDAATGASDAGTADSAPPSMSSGDVDAGYVNTPVSGELSAIDQVGPEIMTVTGPTRTFHVFPIGTPNPDPTVAAETTQIMVVYNDGVFLYDVGGNVAWLDNSTAPAAAAELQASWSSSGQVGAQSLGVHVLGLGTDELSDWLSGLAETWVEKAAPAFEAAVTATGEKVDSLLGSVSIPEDTAAATDARTALATALSAEPSATVGATATTATSAGQVLNLVGDSPIVAVGHSYVDSQDEQYWQRITDDLGSLSSRPPLATQMQLIREIVQDENLPYIADSAGLTLNAQLNGGDCGNASLTGMFSLATGRVVAALAYFMEEGNDNSNFVQAFRQAGVVVTPTPWFKIAANFISSVDSKLADGQMAWLYSGADEGAHATVIVKLEGTLYNVNNQGWEDSLGVPAGQLQTLSQWLASWQADSPMSSGYDSTRRSSPT
jgi:hypothetical protein